MGKVRVGWYIPVIEEIRNTCRNFMRKASRECPLVRSRRRGKDNSRVDLTGRGFNGVDGSDSE
jgi:hypothetical protein